MASYVYPTTDYDRTRNMLALLGSFWSSVYQGGGQVASVVAAKGQVERQTLTDALQVANALSRGSCPIFLRDNWRVLHLLASEKNTSQASIPRYDDNTASHDGSLVFDAPRDTIHYTFPAPSKLADVRQAFNRFTEPSLCWTRGAEFILEDGAITFLHDPFDDARVAKRPVYQDGQVVDEEAVLWLFRGQFDYDTLYRQYGYVINMQMSSSKAYRDLLVAFFDAIVGGTAARQLLMAASAITGVPLVREPTETVEHVSIDNNGRLVITDQHAYRFNEAATPIVEPGDIVHAGDALVDSLQVYELNSGETPDDLRALAMGKGFLSSCYYGDLIFENKDVPLEVDESHPSGFTYVSFGLGGFPLDVRRFFDEMHERGVAASQQPVDECADEDTVLLPGDECEGLPDQRIRRATLAHLLDVRANPIGEPTAASLPAVINPLKFLIENVLRANATIVKIKAAGLGAEGVGLHASAHFGRITPPHTAVILLVELSPESDSVTVDMIEEDLTAFPAMEPLSDDASEAMLGESVNVRIVSGTCQ